ncbi:hypothetical protein [Rhizobium sp. CC-YZS058]|uniref:hypothetical protein n=1 Tax=Rhizobium sp. CC-YZS058 TaxID=3042153 RepID=UPI002B05CA63|nr:hypothetical protein [Rhizobium sp. CC-YZS058]MEA3533724.1 hypothetical protein [Rhizobium sp. CC-YZS058]
MSDETEGGGSYTRQKDGSLKLVERTKPIENEAVDAAEAIIDGPALPEAAPATTTPKKGS